jgi:hypothetical protein
MYPTMLMVFLTFEGMCVCLWSALNSCGQLRLQIRYQAMTRANSSIDEYFDQEDLNKGISKIQLGCCCCQFDRDCQFVSPNIAIRDFPQWSSTEILIARSYDRVAKR